MFLSRRRRRPLADPRQLSLDLYAAPLVQAPPEAPQNGAPLHDVLSAVYLQHPAANRQLVLEHCVVAYNLKRSRRRTVGMRIAHDGLVVCAPHWAAQSEIDRILRNKAAWIVRKLQELENRKTQDATASIDWRDGARLPWLGQELQLQLGGPAPAASNNAFVSAFAAAAPPPRQASLAQLHTQPTGAHTLHLALGAHSAASQVRDAVQAWYMAQAQQLFAQRIAHYAPQLGVRCTALKLSHAGSRWGSASSNGTIRLHWRLLHFSPAVIDYVVVHELSHLREMNHSARFWQTVEQVLPHYREPRQHLKKARLPLW